MAKIELTLDRMWCETHLAPFAGAPEAALPLATPVLFTAFAKNRDVVRYCDGDIDAGRAPDAGRLDAALREFQPACCRVPTGWLDRLTTAALAVDSEALHQLHDEAARS